MRFRRGEVDTGFIDGNLAALGAVPQERDKAAAARGVAFLLGAAIAGESEAADEDGGVSPWAARDGFQLGGLRSVVVPIDIDGEGAARQSPMRRMACA